jgi:two-component system NtrC family sensor kinase
MVENSRNKTKPVPEFLPFDEKHYSDLRRKNIIRLLLTYLAPLLLIIIYFYFQYDKLASESRRLHLQAIAESQANTLDLFLEERLVNLANLIDDPRFYHPPTTELMTNYLDRLKKESATFVDIGYFDSSGIQSAYAGPFPSLEKRNYSTEAWYQRLKEKEDNFIITDIYLGFRQKPHFTIAVSRIIDRQYIVLRATLAPEKIYEYISSLKGANEVLTSIVNKDGYYQVVTPHAGILEESSFVPAEEPSPGAEKIKIRGKTLTYAYAWLKSADWALIVRQSESESKGVLSGFQFQLLGISTIIILVLIFMILNRAQKLVEFQKDSDRTRAQLEHAAKLASVGELAAGIAHEINNPLAVINEEAGLMKDLMNPEYGIKTDVKEYVQHLSIIQESVFRCRDITRKLLGFVRKTGFDLKPHNVHKLIDGVVDGLLGSEMAVSNIEIKREYGSNLPELITDGNQLQQVFLNIINNAIDALEGKPGKITIATSTNKDSIKVTVSDTGKGIPPEYLPRMFMPFFTTKEVGKGTGLGLSVSYGIIKNLGGKIEVDSTPGRGSVFTISLPAPVQHR